MGNKLSKKHIAIPLALLCTLLWGTAFPVIKKCYGLLDINGTDYGTQILFAGERFFIAGIFALIMGTFAKKQLIKIKSKEVLPIFMLGIFQIFGQYIFSYVGLANTSGTKTSVITSLGAFFAVLLSPLFFKNDNLSIMKIVGCIIGFAGVIVINLYGLSFSGFSLIGDGFIVLSTICATAGGFISKKVTKGKSFFTVASYHLLFGGAVLIISGLIMGGVVAFNSILPFVLLIYLAFVSAVSFTIWTALLRYNPVSRILIFDLLIPVFGTIWSGILLGEKIFNATTIVSLLLISLGIALVNVDIRRGKNEN